MADEPVALPADLTYEGASARIEEIIARLDSGGAGLRETLDLVREGRALVEFCAAELDAVGKGLEELRLDELVARLERRQGGESEGGESEGGESEGGGEGPPPSEPDVPF